MARLESTSEVSPCFTSFFASSFCPARGPTAWGVRMSPMVYEDSEIVPPPEGAGLEVGAVLGVPKAALKSVPLSSANRSTSLLEEVAEAGRVQGKGVLKYPEN